MTKKELMRRVNFQPKPIEHREEIEYSSKLTPYQDNERDFCGPFRLKSNVLAEKNDAAALAMCKDSGCRKIKR